MAMRKIWKRSLAVCISAMIGISLFAGCGKEKAEPKSFEGSEAAESSLYVAPIEGMTDDFMRGVDISSYIVQKESGVVYRDFEGRELNDEEFFAFLTECGINWVRVRVWNDPYDKDGNGYGGGNNDLEKAVEIGKLATNAGMRVFVDFHYSDFWADPSKQQAPKDWAHKTFEDKKTALEQFTKESVKKLISEGVDVGMIQVGNETNSGLAGETDSARVYELLKTACGAVREAAAEENKDILIAVHYTNPESADFSVIAGKLVEAGVDFDVMASSYYPYWHGTLENLTANLKGVVENYGKKVIVAETSYMYTDEDGDGFANSVSSGTVGVVIDYDISVQGQANEVRDVMQAVKNVGDAGLGVFYWEPAWIPVQVYDPDAADAAAVLAENKEIWEKYGSGWASSYSAKYDSKDAGLYYGGSSWDNQALFAFDGTPLESLNVFRYVFGGTTAELSIVRVLNTEHDSGIGDAVQMPETVDAMLLDGSMEPIPVTWNAAQVAAAESAGAGDYEISGTAEADGASYAVTCTLHIKKLNYIQNSGFEESDMSMWNIVGEGIAREADNNKHTGTYSLKFYSENPVAYTAEQKISGLPAGTYELAAFLQGGDAGSSAVFELYIVVNGEEYKAATKVTSWQNWDNPVISGVEIPEGAEVTVGVRANADAKAWGAWDDFTLYQE